MLTRIEAAKSILHLCNWHFETETIAMPTVFAGSYTVKDEAVASIEGMRAFCIPKKRFQSTETAADYLAQKWGDWVIDLASQLHEINQSPDKIARLYALSLLFPIVDGDR